MSSRHLSEDARQYGARSSGEIRSTLLEFTREFVLAARRISGVRRIAILGSLLTPKPRPKDADVLVTIDDTVNLDSLAKLGRRLSGSAQAKLNSGADVFLADSGGAYLGRICHYRECHPRVLCRARHCGAVPHLADDLDMVALPPTLIAAPPLELFPTIVVRMPLPDDVRRILLGGVDTEALRPEA
jgi:hypothetical protein